MEKKQSHNNHMKNEKTWRIKQSLHRIGEAAHQEVQEKKARETGLNRRLPGPWRMVEIFTWMCMLTQCAYQRGWDTYEPVTLKSGWDLTNKQVQDEAFRYLERIDPDFIMIAWPCAPWSIMQNANMRTPTQVRMLKLKRLRSRKIPPEILRFLVTPQKEAWKSSILILTLTYEKLWK